MNRYLIEVPHGSDKQSCDETMHVFQQSSSHFLTHADWGCMDGEHKAWIIIEAQDKDEAMLVIPPLYRSIAKIVQLTTFSADDIRETEKYHQG